MNTNHENHDPREIDEARLTAYALGQLDDAERAEVESLLNESDEARRFVAETAALAGHVREAYQQSPVPTASPSLRTAIERRMAENVPDDEKAVPLDRRPKRSWLRRRWVAIVAAGTCACMLVVMFMPALRPTRQSALYSKMESGARESGPAHNPTLGLPIPSCQKSPVDSKGQTSDAPNLPQGPSGSPDIAGQERGQSVPRQLSKLDVLGFYSPPRSTLSETRNSEKNKERAGWRMSGLDAGGGQYQTSPGAEQYDRIVDNDFRPVDKEPLSTFSIDVDTAAYSNVRRFIGEGRLPPPDAVRIEEMVNYFTYDYPQPTDGTPFSVNMAAAQCPWRPEHRLLRIGLKGRQIDRRELGPSNIVFLLDVSGSMNESNKLPLVKQAMRMLVEQLTEDDRVAIVTYASGTGVPLPSARGNEQKRILDTIDSLQAGGSTYGSAGIELAYSQAAEHFVRKGINRVILCTDGDLNVGITNDDDLIRLIEQKAKSGVFLTVLGFGTGNLKDAKMEKLTDHGNGLYAYVDSLREARRVLVEQMTGNLATIAKDVKLQIEFNPAEVAAYRLIGYENRVLANRDFDDDRKDAGEIGAGHTVTALYELVPAGGDIPSGERPLKYQRVPERNLTDAARRGELLTLRLRYKEPDQDESKLLERTLSDSGERFGQASADFRFAAAVAAFGMALRDSSYKGGATLAAVEEYAAGALGRDPNGHRAEFLDLVRRARGIEPGR